MTDRRWITTWQKLISHEMETRSDPGPIIACTLSDTELLEEFDCDYGYPNGKPFLAWTAARVYFPVEYDGADGCGSAPRNPTDTPQDHQNGLA